MREVTLYEVLFENEVVAMGFFMEGSDLMHYHLSANSQLSYSLNANYALLYRLSEIAKAEGKSYLVLGGGTTVLEDDPLLKFKKKFSKETKPFYISGKIYNREVYDNYLKLWEEQSSENIKYFLKYRLELV
jgi:lipid II:glycine glycyltransferase (peptidoglycan interpeptide bridge formation enzyme)